ncbi:reverse transcriptase-like protein [bacterium]|nr:reverse transcriptase-like protein [Candidatus Elulimicrobium humile]
MIIKIHTDGASRGNPGPASIGIVIELPDGTIKTYHQTLGIATNNYAEYQAIIVALEKAKSLVGKTNTKKYSIELYLDSELAQKQLTGIYELKDEAIQKAFIKIWNLRIKFASVDFIHIRRELNKKADTLANKALDKN